MNAENAQNKETGVLDNIVNIFLSPREAFESINQRPAWFVPVLIIVVSLLIMQVATMNIQFQDQIEIMGIRAAQNPEAPQFDPSQAPPHVITIMKIAPFIIGPVTMAFMLLVISDIFILFGNVISLKENKNKNILLLAIFIVLIGIWATLINFIPPSFIPIMILLMIGILLAFSILLMIIDPKYKYMFSMIAWTSLIGAVGIFVRMGLVLLKKTIIGVTTSPAIFLKMPEIGKGAPILYRLLLRFDLFAVWQNILYVVGLAVIYKMSVKKSAIMIGSLWLIYILVMVFFNLDRFMGSPF